MTIYCLFDVVYLNDLHYLFLRAGPPQCPPVLLFDELFDDVVKEVNVKKALKSSKWVRILPGFFWYHQNDSVEYFIKNFRKLGKRKKFEILTIGININNPDYYYTNYKITLLVQKFIFSTKRFSI